MGGTGTGSSAVGADNLNSEITNSTPSTNIALRADDDGQNNGGRFNTTLNGNQFLDSNDTNGIKWTIPGAVPGGLGLFDRILFTLVDVADAGRKLTIRARDTAGAEYFQSATIASQRNATINTVLIRFDDLVSFATIELDNGGRNDGFSIDDATVGAVPLPAAGWLLIVAAGGLFAAKRRQARAIA